MQQRKHYTFKVGDKVWLQAKEIKIHVPSRKLGPKQLGPFEVMEVISEVDYQLKLPPVLKLHDVFHIDHLSPYKGNEVNGLLPPPPEPMEVVTTFPFSLPRHMTGPTPVPQSTTETLIYDR